MPFFDNPFTPDLGFRRGGCLCGRHDSEFEHEKATALEASRQARRRFIADTIRSLVRGSGGQSDAIGGALRALQTRASKA